MQQSRTDRSLGELFGDLSREMAGLVRNEAEYAKAEMVGKATRVARSSVLLTIGGALVYAGLLAITAAAIIWLSKFMPPGASALTVGLVVAGIGAIILWNGYRKLKKEDLIPGRSVEAFKEDSEWMKRPMM